MKVMKIVAQLKIFELFIQQQVQIILRWLTDQSVAEAARNGITWSKTIWEDPGLMISIRAGQDMKFCLKYYT